MCDAKNRKVCLVAKIYSKHYAPPERVVLFYIQIAIGGDAHLNTKSTASCGCGKPRTTPHFPGGKTMAERKTVPVPIRRVYAGASGGMAISSARS